MQTELHESKADIVRLKRLLEQEAKRRAWLENLVKEAIRYQYLNPAQCPPTWIREVELATRR